MREIKFRAISYKTNKFIYGYLWKKKYNTEKIFISHFPNKDDDEIVDVVKKETIGQYTGLKDKNGVAIYEGDVLSDGLVKIQVKYRGGCYYGYGIKYAKGKQLEEWLYGQTSSFEVIGNIHDGDLNE